LRSAHGKRVEIVAGAESRQESVWRALRSVRTDVELVLVHDAARPFPPAAAVARAIRAAQEVGGAILACPVVETIKRVGPDGLIVETPERATLWAAQTPQVFRRTELLRAYRAADVAGALARFTDDAGIFEGGRRACARRGRQRGELQGDRFRRLRAGGTAAGRPALGAALRRGVVRGDT